MPAMVPLTQSNSSPAVQGVAVWCFRLELEGATGPGGGSHRLRRHREEVNWPRCPRRAVRARDHAAAEALQAGLLPLLGCCLQGPAGTPTRLGFRPVAEALPQAWLNNRYFRVQLRASSCTLNIAGGGPPPRQHWCVPIPRLCLDPNG